MKIIGRFHALGYDAVFLSLCTASLSLAVPFLLLDTSLIWFLYPLLWSVTQGTAILLSVWMAMSGRGRPWRIVFGFLALLAAAWGTTAIRSEMAEWTSRFFMWTVFHGLILLLLIRLFGWRIEKTEKDDFLIGIVELNRTLMSCNLETTGRANRKRQFTLADMLAWMTALAVILGTIKATPRISTSLHGGLSAGDGFPLLCMALLSPLLVWTSLGINALTSRTALCVVGIVLASLLFNGLMLVLPASIWTLFLLSCVRVAGFRYFRAT